MTHLLADYYRCPEGSLATQLIECLPSTPGYFQFGSDTVCYGRCSSGVSERFTGDGLLDALCNVRFDGSTVGLPFEPNEIIENLRYERYLTGPRRSKDQNGEWTIARDLYYYLRPRLPDGFRRHIQRLYLKNRKTVRFPCWPVDTTIEKFGKRLLALSMRAQSIDRMPFIWFWPNGFEACTILTHDVETSQGLNFCGQLMDLDDSFGLKASFQLVPEGRYNVRPSLLDEIRKRGFEVNVQDLNHDGLLFSSRATFDSRVAKINKYAKAFGADGFRSAILYHNVDWYEHLAFSYDMSIPNVARLEPQKGGCCTVLPFFVGDVLELPVTTTQDYSLFTVLDDYSIELWKTEIKLIMENFGLVNLIVHPDYIQDYIPRDTYRQLLMHLSEIRTQSRVWFALPGDVNRWWRERSRLNLQSNGGRWSITGPASTRARLAFAVADGESVRYEFHDSSDSDVKV